jgi:transposase InsO family protein
MSKSATSNGSDEHANLSSTPEAQSPRYLGHNTTDGARDPGMGSRTLGRMVIAWLHPMRTSTFSLGHIDALVDACAHVHDFGQLLLDSLMHLDLADSVLASIHAYAIASRDEDFAAMAAHSKSLLTDPASPIFVPPYSSDKKGLPPPTLYATPVPQPPNPEEGKGGHRGAASHIVKDYCLPHFTGDHKSYLSWRFQVTDILKALHVPNEVRYEVILLRIPIDLLCQISQAVDPTSSNRYEQLMRCLDSRFFTSQARYDAESKYYLCKIQARENLPAFVNRFNQVVHNFELATDRILSDVEKIHGLSAGLHETPNAKIVGLLQHLGDVKSFTSFTERLIGLYDVSGPRESQHDELNAADIAVADAKRKRDDSDHHYNPANGNSIRFIRGGCARCKEKSHTASECPNSVKDFERRCKRCGSPRHTQLDCKAPLKRNCKRCGGPHYDQICPNGIMNTNRTRTVAVSNNVIDASPAPESTRISQMFNDIGLGVMECNATSSVSVVPAFTTDVEFGSNTSFRGLLDTGASENFISPEIVGQLIKVGIVKRPQFSNLSPPCSIRFANGHIQQSDSLMRAAIKVYGKDLETQFIVLSNVSPQLILGRPLISALGLFQPPCPSDPSTQCTKVDGSTVELKATSVVVRDPSVNVWIEARPSKGGKEQLFIRNPIMETTRFNPVREAPRSRSAVTEQIILARLLQMLEEDFVEEVSLEECAYICPIVLKDKKSEENLPRSFPDESLHQRYRVTCDLRGFNKLKICSDADGKAFLVPASLSSLPPVKKSVTQYQVPSTEILRHLPVNCHWFSKIDLRDAYNYVKLPVSMRFVCVETYDLSKGCSRFFRFTGMMQGWTLSPCYFRMVASFILDRVRPRLPPNVSSAFFQDDIILGAPYEGKEQLIEATDAMISVCDNYSFKSRPEKVLKAVPQIAFCGYEVSGAGCRPSETRRKFTKSFAQKLWSQFLLDYPQPTPLMNWCRSVAGCFQYLSSHLSPECLAALRKLYSHLSVLSGPEAKSDIPIDEFRQPFSLLANYVCNGLPRLFVGSFSSLEPCFVMTVLLADANAGCWSGLILKLASIPGTQDPDYNPEFQEPFQELKTRLSEDFSIPENARFYPCRLYGGRFDKTAQRLSSTYRERAAQLLLFSEAQSLIEGPVICVSDNANVRKEWHNLEDQFGAQLLKAWTLFSAQVSHTVWLPRSSIPQLADVCARIIETPDLQSQIPFDCGFADVVEDIDSSKIAISDPTVLGMSSILASTEVDMPPSLIQDIIYGYTADTQTMYKGVRMCDIYSCKIKNGNDLRHSMFFEIDQNNLLWYLNAQRPRLYLPSSCTSVFGDVSLRGYVLRRAHTPANIHFGIAKTTTLLEWSWWPSLSRDVADFVNACWVCLQNKATIVRSHMVTRHSTTSAHASAPFQHWCLDHFEYDSRVVLLAVDCFSHLATCYVVRSTSAENIAISLLQNFATFGVPLTLHSDRGSGFTSAVMTELANVMEISTRLSPSANPRSNGLCEKVVGILKSYMDSCPHTASFMVRLQMATLMHNSTWSTKTQVSPHTGAYGLSSNLLASVPLLDSPSTTTFSYELQYTLRRYLSLLNSENLTDRMNDSILASKIPTFKAGDVVVAFKDSGFNKKRHLYTLLSRVGNSIWRALALDASSDSAFRVVELPESCLKKYESSGLIQEFKDLLPPNSDFHVNVASLKRKDFVIIQEGTVCQLHQVLFNGASSIRTKLFKPNALGRFTESDQIQEVPHTAVRLAGFRLLSDKTLPEDVLRRVEQILQS